MSTSVLTAGAPLQSAKAVVIMLHGRGASADGMLDFAQSFAVADVCYLAPQAPGSSWYPHSFLAPLQQNEPDLSNALERVGNVAARVTASGINLEKLVLLGFSQGGCLALEYAARQARRYGGVIGLSAGLIGPAGTARNYAGSLSGTPVFIGCSDADFHIPLARVKESTEVLLGLGGIVTERIYPGLGHTVNADEVLHIEHMLTHLVGERATQ